MSRQRGQHYEALALSFLQNQKLTLLAKNYAACGGEIDLIMFDKETFVFVEVKARSSLSYGFGYEFVEQQKQRKLIKAAKHFLNGQLRPHRSNARFDVLSIDKGKITWIQNAFYADSYN
jgi:putative endonuclease